MSTEQQADGGVSLDTQREKLIAYAKATDLQLVEIVEDAGISAKTLERPGLQAALRALTEGRADGILVVKLDRLTRSVRDLGKLVEDFFTKEFSLLSVSDSIDTRTAAGRLVLNVLTSVAQWEREATGERTREVLAHVRAEGVRLGGEAFGWRRAEATDADGRRVVEDVEDERATLALIRTLHQERRSLRAICAELTRCRKRTKRGGRWSPKVVRSILLREKQTKDTNERRRVA